MLKHKDRRAMNLNDFVVLPNSVAKSVKLNARNLQELKTETGSLAQESDEMEEKLKRLKERMSLEKEERAQSGSFKWKSGQHGLLNNAASSINSRRNKDSRLQKLSEGKVKILEERPTVQPSPPSPATVGTRNMRRNKLKGTACGQCDVRIAGVKCAECSEDYCISCFSKFHQKGALKFHSVITIQTELQTHVSTRDVVSCLPTQPNPSANPATFSSPNPRPNPTHNHGALSDGFTDQRPGNAAAARHMQIQDNSSQILIVHREETRKAGIESSLLNGAYDEEESAKSFQDAVRQWREAEPAPAQEPMWTPPCTVSDVPTQADLCPGGGGEGGKVPVKVKFAECGLTLMDRLLLKKHRRTPIELPPPLTETRAEPLPRSPEKEPEPGVTAEDQGLHRYLTSALAAPTNSQRAGLDISAPGVCLTIEVLDEEDKAGNAVPKSLVNKIIPAPETAGPNKIMFSSHYPDQLFILSRETEQNTTSPPALSAKPEPATDPQGNHSSSIKTSKESKKAIPRSHTSHAAKAKSRGSPQSPQLSSSAPLYRRTHNAPRLFTDSPSTSQTSTSEKPDSYPDVSPALRTTFTLTPSSSGESPLLPKIAENSHGRSSSKFPKQSRQALSEDAAQSDHQFHMSPSPTNKSLRHSHMSNAIESPRKSSGLSVSMQDPVSRSMLSRGGTCGNVAVSVTSEHEMIGSQWERDKQHFISDPPSIDNRDDVLTRRNKPVSTGYAKESTFALIQEYRNALKSIQDSEEEMSSDSLELAWCEEDCTDEDADNRLDSGRSTDDRGNSASVHLDEDFVPAHEKGERDLPADLAQQLSAPARVHSLWSDSDDSSDDSPPDNYRHLDLNYFDAVHQSRTSLDTSTPAELSQAAMIELSGCEDPDMEAETTTHTMSRLERELRLLARETGPEVFAAAPGNSKAQHPRGNRLYTRRKLSKEEEDEEEEMQNDQKRF